MHEVLAPTADRAGSSATQHGLTTATPLEIVLRQGDGP